MNKIERRSFRIWLIFGFVATAAIGLAINLLNLHRMKGDGISYLDLADRYLSLDAMGIANSSWSPLYPFLLAISKAAIRPGQYNEFVMVQFVNFVIFLATLMAFHWLFLNISRHASDESNLRSGYFISICLFVYCSLSLISSTGVTPDMLLFCILLAMTGFLVKYIDGVLGRDALIIGILCGFGFLSKAILFAITPIVFICIAAVSARNRKWKHAILPIAGFLIISAPWIIFLSVSKGRLTFSDIGWINYCIDVGTCENDDRNYYLPVDDVSSLVIYRTQYDSVTFPPWFDLSERWVNAKVEISPQEQARSVIKNLNHTFGFLFSMFTIPFYLSVFLLVCMRFRDLIKVLKKLWMLLVVSLTGSIYFLSHVEERYIAPFLFIFFLPFIITYLVATFEGRDRFVSWLLIFASGITLFAAFYPPIVGWRKMVDESSKTYRAAVTASNHGLLARTKVVVLGSGVDLYWAKLVGINIVGEFEEPGRFWGLTKGEIGPVMCKLSDLGVSAIVTNSPPFNRELDWKDIYPTKAYVAQVTCNKALDSP